VPPPHQLRSPVGATGRPTTPIVSTHSPGFPREDGACTKEVVRPEAVASRLIKVVETTGVGSLAKAGGGRGAAGEHHTAIVHIPRIVHPTQEIVYFSLVL
jgi:hypothetical protein